MRIALLVLALAACNGDKPALEPDSGTQPTVPDAPPEQETTLTTYVIDLIANHTTDTAQPRPYTEFWTLPDPDGATNNLAAYQPLFQ